MKRAYSINPDGTSVPLKSILCTNEEKELQGVLEKNLQLIPGDQINPEDPRRWLCVKRELPIEEPNSGDARWSLDFLLLDQSGIPTFVECKRFLDTRSRREVIGQMFDYAANGIHYFSRSKIFDYLQEVAQRKNKDIESLILEIDPDSGESIDGYLDLVENNLREGQVRLIFFMEESPYELRSIVEFLNNQLERTEVVIVEAQQFKIGDMRITTPTVWGYTEQARRVKKSTVTTSGPSLQKKWNYQSFFESLEENSSQEVYDSIKSLYNSAKECGAFKVRWGKGKVDGSFSLVADNLCPRSFLNIYTTGTLSFPLHWINESKKQIVFRDFMYNYIKSSTSLPITENQRTGWATFKEWITEKEKVEVLIQKVANMVVSV